MEETDIEADVQDLEEKLDIGVANGNLTAEEKGFCLEAYKRHRYPEHYGSPEEI